MRNFSGRLMTKNITTILILLTLTKCTPDKSRMLGADIRLFQGTDAWPLAKAVRDEDTTNITKLIKEGIPVDSRENRFGQTLLIWATNTGHYNSVKALLKNGADPNVGNDYDGESAVVIASNYGFFSGEGDNGGYDTSIAMLRLLLDHGGNPNQVCKGKHPDNIHIIKTPLMEAAGCCLYKTKLLVENGADINFGNGFQSVLFSAAHAGKDRELIVRYLLIDKQADFKSKFELTIDGDTLRITNLLRSWTNDLNSQDYKVKMEIVDYLEKNGMDYWKTKIPKHYYDNYSKEYLEKY